MSSARQPHCLAGKARSGRREQFARAPRSTQPWLLKPSCGATSRSPRAPRHPRARTGPKAWRSAPLTQPKKAVWSVVWPWRLRLHESGA